MRHLVWINEISGKRDKLLGTVRSWLDQNYFIKFGGNMNTIFIFTTVKRTTGNQLLCVLCHKQRLRINTKYSCIVGFLVKSPTVFVSLSIYLKSKGTKSYVIKIYFYTFQLPNWKASSLSNIIMACALLLTQTVTVCCYRDTATKHSFWQQGETWSMSKLENVRCQSLHMMMHQLILVLTVIQQIHDLYRLNSSPWDTLQQESAFIRTGDMLIPLLGQSLWFSQDVMKNDYSSNLLIVRNILYYSVSLFDEEPRFDVHGLFFPFFSTWRARKKFPF